MKETKRSDGESSPVTAKAPCNCMSPLTITVEQAGKLLGVGRSTAYALKSRGELPYIIFGGKTLVPVQALREMMGRMSDQALEGIK